MADARTSCLPGVSRHFELRADARLFLQVLHQLTARAVIKDWEEGSLHADKYEHEVREPTHVLWSNTRLSAIYMYMYVVHLCNKTKEQKIQK